MLNDHLTFRRVQCLSENLNVFRFIRKTVRYIFKSGFLSERLELLQGCMLIIAFSKFIPRREHFLGTIPRQGFLLGQHGHLLLIGHFMLQLLGAGAWSFEVADGAKSLVGVRRFMLENRVSFSFEIFNRGFSVFERLFSNWHLKWFSF